MKIVRGMIIALDYVNNVCAVMTFVIILILKITFARQIHQTAVIIMLASKNVGVAVMDITLMKTAFARKLKNVHSMTEIYVLPAMKITRLKMEFV
jgi:hypothetical protein